MENEPVITVPQPVVAVVLPGAFELLKQAWGIYKQRFGVLVGITLVPSILMFAATFGADNSYDYSAVGLSALLVIIGVIIHLWSTVALLCAIQGAEEGIGMRESYARGCKKILSYLWVAILASFIILGGISLLIIPGIIVAVFFSLAMYVLVDEDKKGMDALMRSRQLVRGNWGGVLWRIFCVGLVAGFASLVLGIFNIVGIEGLGDLVASILVTPLIVTFMFTLYKHLKAAKAGEAPTEESKTKYIAIGVVGVLLIPAIFIFFFGGEAIWSERIQEAASLINSEALSQ